MVFTDEWQLIVEQVDSFRCSDPERLSPLWFRGQARASWTLLPTLHRYVQDLIRASGEDVPAKTLPMILRQQYHSWYLDFRSDAWSLLAESERTEWGIVFAMRHYGFPTRLLDWTESFACALYFALMGREPNCDAAVFVLNPEQLNASAQIDEGVVTLVPPGSASSVELRPWHPQYHWDPDTRTIAVQPDLTNRRMLAQRARFTMVGDSFCPLEQACPNAITKIVIPADVCPSAQAFLDLAGVDDFSLFPDLEGLRRKFVRGHESHVRHISEWAEQQRRGEGQ